MIGQQFIIRLKSQLNVKLTEMCTIRNHSKTFNDIWCCIQYISAQLFAKFDIQCGEMHRL